MEICEDSSELYKSREGIAIACKQALEALEESSREVFYGTKEGSLGVIMELP